MKIKVIMPTKEFECCVDCPFYCEEQGEVAYCGHEYFKDKNNYEEYIITFPECINGFPQECPLLKQKGENNEAIKNVV